jgi:hypothetical protein
MIDHLTGLVDLLCVWMGMGITFNTIAHIALIDPRLASFSTARTSRESSRHSSAPAKLIAALGELIAALENFFVALENFFVALENFLASADTHSKKFWWRRRVC